ncbi:MAG: beta-ketoacyl synthase N-terminal-like domain-containing protein [Bdellovibrionales bacterium]
MAWLESYGCATTAGDSVADLWNALLEGRDCSQTYAPNPALRAFQFKNRPSGGMQQVLVDKLLVSFAPVRASLLREGMLGEGISGGEKFGVILASTKGMSEDFVWDSASAGHASDPLTPILNEFLKRSELTPARALCVSNACSSSLAAMALAEKWMAQGLSQVLILAADGVTPFVIKGFQALKLVSPGGIKPFSADRSGFYLGDAAACLLLTRERRSSDLRLHPVGLDSEGSAVTRPSHSGVSLRQAALRIPDLLNLKPDILIAHGTGTVINDETEDLAFSGLFSEENRPLITGTKWCVGHTLAASGALDLIAAAEALRTGKLFRLMTTETPDPKFNGRYLTKNSAVPAKFSRIMISSLGFGGMHASALLERELS